MTMPRLPNEWDPTRTTLQAYSQALSAFPRAAGVADDRWTHVAMTIVSNGLVATEVPLSDGLGMVTTIDLVKHEILVEAGSDVERIDLLDGPSVSSVGASVLGFAERHGTVIEADTDRFSGTDTLVYVPEHAEVFLAAAKYVDAAFRLMNASLTGEVTGPHLWPHGFDIATEWYSPVRVPSGDGDASAQIAVGWYPADDGYFYANPWPFTEAWSDEPVIEGSTWHLENWQGAVVDADGIERSHIVAFGLAVHELARESLTS